MKNWVVGVVAGVMGFLLVACQTLDDDGTGRVVQSLSGEWKFLRATDAKLNASAIDFRDREWKTVCVPHDWSAKDAFVKSTYGSTRLPWPGLGWYRKRVEVTPARALALRNGAAAWLEFDGVMAQPRVYVNGKLVGGWDYGYASFRVNVASALREGENVIAVRADSRAHGSRWICGSGLYRDCRLVFAPAARVLPDSVFVTTPQVSPAEAQVKVSFALTNATQAVVSLYDSDGEFVATASGSSPLTLKVPQPKLWDVESPSLYIAQIEVPASGDHVETWFGIRTATFTADDGFHLNGRRLQLKGVNLHSDMGILGAAFNREVMTRQLLIMKDMGVNALRTSHNCPDPQVLELCDEMGFVVWDECFDKWNGTADRPDTAENLEDEIGRNLYAMTLRDRNHPCVVAWSIGNEIYPAPPAKGGWKTGVARARCKALRDWVRKADTTRPVGIGACHTMPESYEAYADLDLTGWNYERKYQGMKKAFPTKPVVYTESASAVSTYGFYEVPQRHGLHVFDKENCVISSYDVHAPYTDIPDVEFERMARDRYCAGEFVWTGIDYLGEPTPLTDCGARSSSFGVVDLTGVPKDRFYLYRAHWNEKKHTIHILPHWNWAGREGQNVPVFVYTDGDEAELFLNGRSLGRRKKGVIQKANPNAVETFRRDPYYEVTDKYRLRWLEVPYAPGELKVVAYKSGKEIGTQTMRTCKKPVAVRLTYDPYNVPGADIKFVQVDLVDAAGTRDPWAKQMVSFKAHGDCEILAVGNGNPMEYRPFGETSAYPLYFGKAMLAVRITGEGDFAEASIEADCPGLESAELKIL